MLPATHHLEDPALVVIANQIYKDTRIREALIVLNKVSEKDVERQLRVKLDKKGIRPIGIIHDYPGITYSWLNGEQLAIPEAHDEILKIVSELEAAEGAYIQAKAAVKKAHDHTENPILS